MENYETNNRKILTYRIIAIVSMHKYKREYEYENFIKDINLMNWFYPISDVLEEIPIVDRRATTLFARR